MRQPLVLLLEVLALAALPSPAAAEAEAGTAAPGRISTAAGDVGYFRADLQCRAPGSDAAVPLGAVLEGTGAETLYDQAVGLRSLLASAGDGYALTVATRAFSTGITRGGGDVLLMGLAPDFTPRWATVYGGPAPDGPLSMSRTADGGLAVVGTSRSNYAAPSLLRLFKESPETIVVSKHGADGRLQWAQSHTPGDLVIANPIVTLSDGGVALGGTVWRDRRYAGFVARVDDDGRPRWTQVLGPDFETGVTWLVPTADGGLLATGPRQRVARPGVKVSDLPFEIWLARLRADGTLAWAKSYAAQSGFSQVIAAPLRHRPGWLIVREPRYDQTTDTSRFPIFEVDEAGAPRWSAQYEIEGDGRVTALLPADDGGHLLFGPASPQEGRGGTLAIGLGPDGEVRSSSWVDVAAALSSDERVAFLGGDPVAAVRDADGRHVLMGDFMSLPRSVVSGLGPGARPPAHLRDQLKGAVFLLRTGADGQVQGCSLPLRVTRAPMPLGVADFDLVATPLPAPPVTDIPAGRLDLRRLEPR